MDPVDFQLRRPPRHRRGHAVPATATGVAILSVSSMTSQVVRITFATEIAHDGSSVPVEFQCITGSGLQPCESVWDVGLDWIELAFAAAVAVGAAWQVDGPMAGITPSVAWPQSGNVE
jgi:hypothetical protein